MSILEAVEHNNASATKRTAYTCIFIAAFIVELIATASKFFGLKIAQQPRPLTDFDAFFISGKLALSGGIAKAYHLSTMRELQLPSSSREALLNWAYPPQFDLLVAPTGLLHIGVAYTLFTGATLIAYLTTLRRTAGESFLSVLILLFPVVVITIACGQNGFLTGTLIGLTCLGLRSRGYWAGLPLGLMVIKPHLAVAVALYTLVTRRWGVIATAAFTVAATSVLATALLGPQVWVAFGDSIVETESFLSQGLYPLFRMISVYAVVRTLGFSGTTAASIQCLVALLALWVTYRAGRRLSIEQGIGMAVIATLLISPYAYDYDLTILGIGLALLLRDLQRLGTASERALLYGLIFLAGGWGLAQNTRLSLFDTTAASAGVQLHQALSGAAMAALFGLCWRILQRDPQGPEAQSQNFA